MLPMNDETVGTGKPLVLLDVDGVVNAWPDRGDERHSLRLAGMKVYLSDETLYALKKVFDVAEVIWCTAWREQANEFMPFLREKMVTKEQALGYISDGRTLATGGFTTHWKWAAVQKDGRVRIAIAAGRPVYWFEDFEWGVEGGHTAAHYTDLHEFGITGIDTAAAGKLLQKHLEGTVFA